MEALGGILIGTQLVFTIIAGLYFYTNLKTQHSTKSSIRSESQKELDKMKRLRNIHLTKPLSEKTRPQKFSEIIGQEKAIRALRAAICGPNPQHVIIYGPPGVGKTAAARLAMKNAQDYKDSPFEKDAPFIEVDATVMQFDERSIADPLIGSVHDPIYQGAGAYGPAGIPQPKPGAVTKAHGGILFIDEIGEMHPIQMNKLLKVLEDGKVILSSSYYSKEDSNIPRHIHDIFDNGLPADFRLIGATTRSPEQIPAALRSRCTEIFFRGLNKSEVRQIAANALKKAGFEYDSDAPELISCYSSNGRDTVNIVQTAASVAAMDGRTHIQTEDIEEVIEYGRYVPVMSKTVTTENKIGVVNGLAVMGGDCGALLEIEINACPARQKGGGSLTVTGIIEEEEINSHSGKVRRQSTARCSVENVITVVGRLTGLNPADYDLHLNFPGGMPVDGPSAGIAIFTALYSALTGKEISSRLAMTGEITIKGRINPVGGVSAKIEAAVESGIEKVYIPKANYHKGYEKYPLRIVCLESINELVSEVFGEECGTRVNTAGNVAAAM